MVDIHFQVPVDVANRNGELLSEWGYDGGLPMENPRTCVIGLEADSSVIGSRKASTDNITTNLENAW
jgi:hypothetical protein